MEKKPYPIRGLLGATRKRLGKQGLSKNFNSRR
jgi:hypothetical protein